MSRPLFSASLPNKLPIVKGKQRIPEGVAVLSIRLPVELHQQLRATAKENDRTISQEARRAISQHIAAEQGAAYA